MQDTLLTRLCKKCSHILPIDKFEITNREHGWRRHECRSCTNKRVRDWWNSIPPSKRKARIRRQYELRRDVLSSPDSRRRINARVKTRRMLLREQVHKAYGGKCKCCGEKCSGFLTLDHVNSDGHLDRKGRGGGGQGLYYRLIREKFPKTFQLLCFNCNLGRALNGGVCPHRIK